MEVWVIGRCLKFGQLINRHQVNPPASSIHTSQMRNVSQWHQLHQLLNPFYLDLRGTLLDLKNKRKKAEYHGNQGERRYVVYLLLIYIPNWRYYTKEHKIGVVCPSSLSPHLQSPSFLNHHPVPCTAPIVLFLLLALRTITYQIGSRRVN